MDLIWLALNMLWKSPRLIFRSNKLLFSDGYCEGPCISQAIYCLKREKFPSEDAFIPKDS